MGKRSGVPDTDEAVERLTLEELDAEIRRCELMMTYPPFTSRKIKSIESRLIWLGKHRRRRFEEAE